ncbi:Zn-ribbon domain-containing OB-fold protein [Nocardioides massiliensis]|uniref:OB-fold protein n=1 Tax=Nocardioides massiliensis TaxID=1325935 RepID=A0ABT9NIL8_9ACTN|nr:OB-fold domain-containing protein [Nocardioides massiliensis]MDP9820253.1 putative OB-fold protein [Nocardioides massiliensis]
MATPAVDWFTTGPEPALVGSTCTHCGTHAFPPETTFCKNPACSGEEFAATELSRRGRVWSYTDAQYQPPPPYIPRTDPYEPFALAAVELDEGLVVLGQVADGYGVADLKVGAEVELVVEPLYVDEDGEERTVWRWKPVQSVEPHSSVEPVETIETGESK